MSASTPTDAVASATKSDDALDTAALGQLQSKDLGKLLDDIDNLRSQGVSNYINLPQLIVCGDQSSGKSSVLEAISRVPFPTKDNLCTRFATELVLRRTPTVNVAVSIRPAPSRTPEQKEELLSFSPPFTSANDFPVLIEEAKERMINSGGAFCEDVLCIEHSGPDRPHLTIVDLPGLIQSQNKQQSQADVALVKTLVQRYMSNSRSIILAIVSAQHDYANQVVTSLAQQFDPEGRRTLGIITKPDTLHPGSENELRWFDLANNKDVKFQLGWHVLRNRDYPTRNASNTERDNSESTFFSEGIWRELPSGSKGIDALRVRLQKVFAKQICSDLPIAIDEIRSGVKDCRNRLEALGSPRPTAEEQRRYLRAVSAQFHDIVREAVEGTYLHSFFHNSPPDNSDCKRLRALVQNMNEEFAVSMHQSGHEQEIVEDGTEIPIGLSPDQPRIISRSEYVNQFQDMIRNVRGTELQGTVNPIRITELFRKQSRPWKHLAYDHLSEVWVITGEFLAAALQYVTNDPTYYILQRGCIEPEMEKLRARLEAKLTELLRPYESHYPMTYDIHFQETVELVRNERSKQKPDFNTRNSFLHPEIRGRGTETPVQGASAQDWASATTPDQSERMYELTCSGLVDFAQAYYKIAIKTFIDNIAALAVENCLIAELGHILSTVAIDEMDEYTVELLAGEPDEVRTEREALQKKLKVLEAGEITCSRHAIRAVDDWRTRRNDRRKIPTRTPSTAPPNPQSFFDAASISPGIQPTLAPRSPASTAVDDSHARSQVRPKPRTPDQRNRPHSSHKSVGDVPSLSHNNQETISSSPHSSSGRSSVTPSPYKPSKAEERRRALLSPSPEPSNSNSKANSLQSFGPPFKLESGTSLSKPKQVTENSEPSFGSMFKFSSGTSPFKPKQEFMPSPVIEISASGLERNWGINASGELFYSTDSDEEL